MTMLTATVVNGHLDLPPGVARDGQTVTILVAEAEEGFRLSAEDRARLLESIAQADRGEVRDGWTLLAELEG